MLKNIKIITTGNVKTEEDVETDQANNSSDSDSEDGQEDDNNTNDSDDNDSSSSVSNPAPRRGRYPTSPIMRRSSTTTASTTTPPSSSSSSPRWPVHKQDKMPTPNPEDDLLRLLLKKIMKQTLTSQTTFAEVRRHKTVTYLQYVILLLQYYILLYTGHYIIVHFMT
jgi:DNA mismatch repair ATPase MutL